MSNQSRFEGATIELLKHLKSKKEAMQMRHVSELAEIDKEIEAVSITVRLLRESSDAPSEMAEDVKPTIIPNDLTGKSTRVACIEIAKRNNGVVFVSEAKKALIAARILKESKNTWAIVYTTLQRSKEFEKTGVAGGFRLIGSAEPANGQGNLLQ